MTPNMFVGLPLAKTATEHALVGALAGDRVLPLERRRPGRRTRR